MIPYSPANVPAEYDRAWLEREFAALKAATEAAKDNDIYRVLHAAPARILAGMVVNADGADFNPGSGAGIYRRSEDNTTWVHLG